VLLLEGVYLTEIGASDLYCGAGHEWYMISPAAGLQATPRCKVM
jgi:hypothetical protein